MILDLTVILLAIIVYTFVFWHRLREDYEKEKVFSASFYALFGAVVFFVISRIYFYQWWFWMTAAGSFLGLLAAISRFVLKFTETVEAWAIANVFFMEFALLPTWVKSGNINTNVLFVVNSFLIVIFFLVDRYYKRFSWYKSGKVGFSGFLMLGLFFLARSVIAFVFSDMVSFVGVGDAYISAVLAFVSFLAVFNLSRSSI